MCSDIFVLPTREDIWGLVIAEAMSQGCPCISSINCVAAQELINENNGVLLFDNNHESYQNAILKLLSDPERLINKSRASIRTASLYTLEKMANEHLTIFKELLDEK